MHIHAETKGYPCGVDLCTKAFKRLRELQAHRKTHGGEMLHRENRDRNHHDHHHDHHNHDQGHDHDRDHDHDHDMDDEDEEMGDGDGDGEGEGEGEGEGSSSPAPPRSHEPPDTIVIDKKSASPPGGSPIILSNIFRAGGPSTLSRSLGYVSAASKPQNLASQSPEVPKMDHSSRGMQSTLLPTPTQTSTLEQFVSQDDEMKSDDDKPG